MISRSLLVAGLLLVPIIGAAQEGRGFDPILAPRHTPVPSSLSDGRREDLRAGVETMPEASAEAAGLPGPGRALAMAAELRLTSEQITTIESMASAALADAQRLGRGILEHEARLDSIFVFGDPRDWNVRPVVLEIGRLETELRYVHLRARMRMKEILSAEQQRRYVELAGGAARAGHVRE